MSNKISEIIREKRHSLGLTQEELAVKAGVTYTTLTKIESGYIKNPSSLTIQRITSALGISTDSVLSPIVRQGKDALQQIFDDALTCLTEGDCMYLSGIEERRYLKSDKQGINKYIKELKKRSITQKIISCEGDSDMLEGDHLEYRWIPKQHFQSTPMYIYGDKIAYLIWEPELQSIIIENKTLAEAMRKQFLFIWEKLGK